MPVTRLPVTISTKTVAAATREKNPVGLACHGLAGSNPRRPIAAPPPPSTAEAAKSPTIHTSRSVPPSRAMPPTIRRFTAAETRPAADAAADGLEPSAGDDARHREHQQFECEDDLAEDQARLHERDVADRPHHGGGGEAEPEHEALAAVAFGDLGGVGRTGGGWRLGGVHVVFRIGASHAWGRSIPSRRHVPRGRSRSGPGDVVRVRCRDDRVSDRGPRVAGR